MSESFQLRSHDSFGLRLRSVIGLNDDGELAPLLPAIEEDFAAVGRHIAHPFAALKQAVAHLRKTLSVVRNRLPTFRSPAYRLWQTDFPRSHGRDDIDAVRKARACALAVALATDKRIPDALAVGIRQSVLPRSARFESASRAIAAWAVDKRVEIGTARPGAEADLARALNELQEAVAAAHRSQWKDLGNVLAGTAPTVVRKQAAEAAAVPEPERPVAVQAAGFISARRARIESNEAARRSPRRATLAHLDEQAIRAANKTMEGATLPRERLLACLTQICFLTSSTYAQACRLPFHDDGSKLPPVDVEAWIDTEAGQVCWRWSALTGVLPERWSKSKADSSMLTTDDVMRLPMPTGLNARLRELRAPCPAPGSVGRLCEHYGVDVQCLSAYIKKVFQGAYYLNQGGLSTAFGRIVLTIERDELTAAAISMDFDLCPLANFHYATLSCSQINQSCRKLYQRCGLGEPESFTKDALIGTPFLVDPAPIAAALSEGLAKARDAFATLPPRCAPERLREAQNLTANALHDAVVFFSGHRTPDAARIPAMHVSPTGGELLIVHERGERGALHRRLAVLPTVQPHGSSTTAGGCAFSMGDSGKSMGR